MVLSLAPPREDIFATNAKNQNTTVSFDAGVGHPSRKVQPSQGLREDVTSTELPPESSEDP